MRITSLFIIITTTACSSLIYAKTDQAFCSQYAQTAVNQQQQNQQFQCGFNSSRWSNDKEGQLQWCLTVNEKIATAENQARQHALEQCNSNQKISAKPLAESKIESEKYPRVQQYFPPKADKTNLQKLGFKNLNGFFSNIRMSIFDFTLASGGRWLAQGSSSTNDSTLKIWDLDQGKLLYLLGEEKGSGYFRLTFSPDEKVLVAGDNETTDIWDWKNARLLFRLKGYFLPHAQVFDSAGKIYLVHEDDQTITRFNLNNGLQEGSWKFGEKHDQIHSIAISQNGDIAITIFSLKASTLKVYSTKNNQYIHVKSIPYHSIYNNEGDRTPNNSLRFLENSRLAYYSRNSTDSPQLIAVVNLKTQIIEETIPTEGSKITLDSLDHTTGTVDLCPVDARPDLWSNIKQLTCTLKEQSIKNDRVVSTYTINNKSTYKRTGAMHQLNTRDGDLLAFFGAGSGDHWFWLDVKNGSLKNAYSLWSNLPRPNKIPSIYHFPPHIVPLKPNQKTTKQYVLPKADTHRLEVFMGADSTIQHEPNIHPSYGTYELSHNGKLLIVGGQDGDRFAHFDLWDLKNKRYIKSLQSTIAWTHSSLAFSPDDRYLAIYHGSMRGNYAPCLECESIIDIWDLQSSTYKFSIPILKRNNHTSDPLIMNNGDMYVNVDNKEIQRWNIKQEIFLDRLRPAKKHEEVFSITGNGGDLLAISVEKVLRKKDDSLLSATSWVEIWSVSKQKVIQKINVMEKPVRGGLEFNTVFVNNTDIAVATRLNDIALWNAVTGKKLRTLVPAKKDHGYSYSLSSEGNGILISSSHFIQRWNTLTGELLNTVNACQPDMPGLPVERYAQLKDYHGSGSAKVGEGKVVSVFNCPQGARAKVWNMQTGEAKALFGMDYHGEWFWLDDQEKLTSTIAPPPRSLPNSHYAK